MREAVRRKSSAAKRPFVKNPAAKRPAVKKPAVVKRTARRKPEPKLVGVVTHYFPRIRVAVVSLRSPLVVGDRVRIKGHTTDFIQSVSSMQLDHVPLTRAKKGDIVGLLVQSRVRGHDQVIRL